MSSARVSAWFLLAWHRVVSPWLPGACRYEPSCSVYGAEALRVHGFWKGWVLALSRLSRCHPWGGQGWDPVPVPTEVKRDHEP